MDRYFLDINEIIDTWDDYPLQKRMFTIKKQENPVLYDHIEKITIDVPQVKIDDIYLSRESQRALDRTTKNIPAMREKVFLRKYQNCYGHSNYLKQISVKDLKRLFLAGGDQAVIGI